MRSQLNHEHCLKTSHNTDGPSGIWGWYRAITLDTGLGLFEIKVTVGPWQKYALYWVPFLLLLRQHVNFVKKKDIQTNSTLNDDLCNTEKTFFFILKNAESTKQPREVSILLFRHYYFFHKDLMVAYTNRIQNTFLSGWGRSHSVTHHTPLTHLVDRALGIISDPCCMKPPTGNHRLFPRVYWFSNMSLRSRRHGWGLYHS